VITMTTQPTTTTPAPKPCPLSEFPPTCPHCGAKRADGWVKGYHGWTCGSYSRAHHDVPAPQPLNIIQSTDCAVTHWRRRAELAEWKYKVLSGLLETSNFDPRDGTPRRGAGDREIND